MNFFKKATVKVKRTLNILGPGLITGASDDDPSGIATYSQAGATFGMLTLWTALLTFPLMACIQRMCAKIGIITGQGLTSILKQHYPKPVLYLMMVFSFPAIVLNIGADVEGMGAVGHLLFPAVPVFAFSLLFSIVLVVVIIKYSYHKLSAILKWLCITLFLYIVIPFIIHVNWSDVARHTFIPTIQFNRDFFEMLVAILGTTISPYLFFWQTTMEAEDKLHRKKKIMIDKRILTDMKKDVDFGMFSSNLVMFFIILTTGTVLYNAGIRKIDTIDQAALALEPLTGKMTYLFFSIGVIGTGLLAIPVLAGSLSYIMAETFSWEEGLDKKFSQAKGFYITMIISVALGLILNFVGISPIQALIYTAVLYGLTAPVMIVILIHICNSKKIMKEYTNTLGANILAGITLLLMTAAAVALIYFQFY